MPSLSDMADGHRRASSGSTVRAAVAAAARSAVLASEAAVTTSTTVSIQATLWVHDSSFSTEEILLNPSVLSNSNILEGSLVQVSLAPLNLSTVDSDEDVSSGTSDHQANARHGKRPSRRERICLCIVKFATADMLSKHPGLEISITKTIADAFNLRSRAKVLLKPASFDTWTASHIELSFRDAYLARADMWRLLNQELANKIVYVGQKVSFLGSTKLTVKEIHVKGRRVSTGFFAATTVPIFRSEAARYVLFIQMSREMWDFDAEGNGEIMFNRVINGFLPDLFRRWVQLEVRHLVSIVMFGRLEYDRYDFGDSGATSATDKFSQSSTALNTSPTLHQDFFRVVVTDMASAQWTTILNELKKDFQVFLRDISLHKPVSLPAYRDRDNRVPKITGRPSTALKGNILEAINLASSQFANDYIDRDLIRTGVSTIVITAGTGVFDVDRDLLNLTSQNLTTSGIGIDVVCLSSMPLHSVPLFRYRLPLSNLISRVGSVTSAESRSLARSLSRPSALSVGQSSALSSLTGTSVNYFSRFPSAFPSRFPQPYGYGIPHWIDLSYWTPAADRARRRHRRMIGKHGNGAANDRKPFTPRVRMYELQMMGLMELGMADISIPYLAEKLQHSKRSRRHASTDMSQLPSQHLSQSPSYSRKPTMQVPQKNVSTGVLAQKVDLPGTSLENMEEYDELLFRNINRPRRKRRPKAKPVSPQIPSTGSMPVRNGSAKQRHSETAGKDSPGSRASGSLSLQKTSSDHRTTDVQGRATPLLKPPRISRSISYALRGLPAPLRSSINTKASVENLKASPSLATTSLTQANAATTSIGRLDSLRGADAREADARSVLSSDSATEHPSKPISISGSLPRPVSQQVTHKLDKNFRARAAEENEREKQRALWPASDAPSSDEDTGDDGEGTESVPDSIPRSTLPFIRNVNASNPLKRNVQAESMFGRWQHLYPRKPRASTVKWRSLCTPASVPLTTEDFPTLPALAGDYERKEHRVLVRHTHEGMEMPATLNALLWEMVILRLSHGYQVVLGQLARSVVGGSLCETSVFVDPTNLSRYGDTLLMSMGNTIQKLSFTEADQIHVTIYAKKEIDDEPPFPPRYHYDPNIRTILSDEYLTRSITLTGPSEEYPWETADNYLADGEIDSETQVNKLRFWRARFVLLPVEPPPNAWRPQQNSDDNEEEIHLLGIRALTQMWQKARYFAPAERKVGPGRMGNVRRRDENPLEIKFDTLDPSDLVATELDKLLAVEGSGEVSSTQLLPDSEKLDRDTSMAKLAQAMQGERGIEIKNRRWHWRLHYNCFHGEEFTNWLLHNVKNIDSREEVVEFGNQLMKEGLFEHVNGRHHFKDGNYFYSLKQDFRLPKIDTRTSWFPAARRSEKSIPATPLTEHSSRELPQMTTRSRSGSSLAYSLNPTTPLESSNRTFLDKRNKTVTLTKMIRIDVDMRKRSNRSEIINLHYDRFHNPENCYHIELSWLNATSKLVDDAIIAWTTQAEKYGLKLVEVPIVEASKIPEAEPFRKVYRIRLAVEPPKRQVVGHVLTSHSFTPQPQANPDKHLYQKAILKRFNFVLDLEGRSEFPENVDVQFSSAGLEYKLTQFVHRSGVVLAQIDDEGDLLLLANRLYNARFANSKEAINAKFDNKKESTVGPGFSGRPAGPSQQNAISAVLAASGIVGLNMQSPRLSATPVLSPMARASADVFGSYTALSSSSVAQYVTPESIKDEIEQFCHDTVRLEQFYRDLNSSSQAAVGSRRRSTAGGTSSSVLQPIPDVNEGIPEFVLPESVASPSTSYSGFGSTLGGLISRRARTGAAQEPAAAEMFGRAVRGAESDHGGTSKGRDSSDSVGLASGDHVGQVSNDAGGATDNKNEEDEGANSSSHIDSEVGREVGDVLGSHAAISAELLTRREILSVRTSRRASDDVDANIETEVDMDVDGDVNTNTSIDQDGARRIQHDIEEGMRDTIG